MTGFARWITDGQTDRLAGEGRASNSVLQESMQIERLTNGRRVICCGNTDDGFLIGADGKRDPGGLSLIHI